VGLGGGEVGSPQQVRRRQHEVGVTGVCWVVECMTTLNECSDVNKRLDWVCDGAWWGA
jgi:hypothetical protein